MFQSLVRVTDRRCAEKPHPPVWHLSVRCFRTCSLSACLLSSSRRSCSISSYLLLCSRSCCFLSSRSRRCCCRWKPFYTTTPQLSACPCVSVCVCVRVRHVFLAFGWAEVLTNRCDVFHMQEKWLYNHSDLFLTDSNSRRTNRLPVCNVTIYRCHYYYYLRS